jgi:hypothetical protein
MGPLANCTEGEERGGGRGLDAFLEGAFFLSRSILILIITLSFSTNHLMGTLFFLYNVVISIFGRCSLVSEGERESEAVVVAKGVFVVCG